MSASSPRKQNNHNHQQNQVTMLKAEFVGHLGADAEIKDFNGKRFIAFNVATCERFKDAQGNTVSRTTWVSCLKPGDGAVVQYLKKGTQVFCRGNLTAKPYTGRNGVEAGLNCTVTELELLGSRQDGQNQQQTQPGQQYGTQGYGGGAYGSGYPGAAFPGTNEDVPY